MRLALAYARAETVQLVRYPGYWIPTIGFPAVVLVLLGQRLERGEPERLLAGFAALSLVTITFFQFGVGIAANRTTPWETFLRTLPISIATRLAGRVLSALVFAAATVTIVAATATALFDARLTIVRWALLVLALLLGSIPFALLGIGFGYWLSPRAALPVANLLLLPLVIAGAFWARPADDVPRLLDLASQCLPARNWMEILDSIATGDSPLPLHHVAALAGWGVVFFAFAWWAYRRDEGERFR